MMAPPAGQFDDTADIVAGLTARFPELVAHLYPGAMEHKGRVYPSAKGKKDMGSFEIVVSGAKAGQWYRHSQGVGGGALALIAYTLTGSTAVTRDTFDEARRFLGMERAPRLSEEEKARREAFARQRAAEAEARASQARAEEERAEAERQDSAHHLWESAKPIEGTPGELYLLNRTGGCLQEPTTELRYLPRCRHSSGSWSGAIICRVSDVSGDFTGVWRIWVTEAGEKAFGKESKMGLGPTAGGAVRMFGDVADEIAVSEGVETGVAVRIITRARYPVWPTLSTSGMRSFQCPFGVKLVRIFVDGDLPRRDREGRWQPSPGISAGQALAARLAEEGIACVLEPPPRAGRDYLDVLTQARARGIL